MKYNPDTQKLFDIAKVGKSNWIRVYCKDGEVFEAWPDCFTYVPTEEDNDDDYDLPALLFKMRNGRYCEVAGVEIDRFEILEPRE